VSAVHDHPHVSVGRWDDLWAPRARGARVRLRPVSDPERCVTPREQHVALPDNVDAVRAVAATVVRILRLVDTASRQVHGLTPIDSLVWRLAIDTVTQIQPPDPTLAPSVTPTLRGDLQLDWSLDDAIIEVLITPQGGRHVSIETRGGDEIWDGDFEGDGVRMIRKELANARSAR
jgi:hypothetical protein